MVHSCSHGGEVPWGRNFPIGLSGSIEPIDIKERSEPLTLQRVRIAALRHQLDA